MLESLGLSDEATFSPNWLHVGTAVLNVLWFFVFGIIVLVDFGSIPVVVAAEGVIVLFVAGPFFLMFLYSLRLRSMAKKEEFDMKPLGNLGYYVLVHLLVHGFLLGCAARLQWSTPNYINLTTVYFAVITNSMFLALFGIFFLDMSGTSDGVTAAASPPTKKSVSSKIYDSDDNGIF